MTSLFRFAVWSNAGALGVTLAAATLEVAQANWTMALGWAVCVFSDAVIFLFLQDFA